MIQNNIVRELQEVQWKSVDKAQAVLDIWFLGYNLIPACNKKSLVEWKRWQTHRIGNETLCQWLTNPWQVSPINFYLLTGACPYSHAIGLVAIDGDDEAACLEIERRCPPTAMMTRTSRGRHYFYRHPGCPVSNRNGTRLDGVQYKLDLKADGGYVGCPGGVKYLWSAPWTRELVESLPAYDPSWLPHEGVQFSHNDLPPINTGTPHGEREEQAQQFLDRCSPAIAGQGANNKCFAIACSLVHGFMIEPTRAIEMLEEWTHREDQQHYGWTHREIENKIYDALAREYRGIPGDRLDPYYHLDDKLQAVFAKYAQGVE